MAETLPAETWRAPGAQQFGPVEAVLEAEQALLGLLLFEPALTPLAARLLAPEDFHGAELGLSANALIFHRLCDDAERERDTDLNGLALSLGATLDGLGGLAYLRDLSDKAGNAAGLPELVRQLATLAAQRRIARAIGRPGFTADDLAGLLQAEAKRSDVVAGKTKPLRATPFVWREPSEIPRREWLYDHHLIRRFVSATFAPGGVGKTMLLIVEALAMVTGRPLLGVKPREPLRVWLINLEDPREEIERRIAAACKHYSIAEDEIAGRLFIDSGRDDEIVVARTTRGGVEVCSPCVRQLAREIAARAIDVLIIDPFVACHEVEENSNGAINVVIKQWAGIADRTACGVELVHHVKKAGAGQTETTVEDGRGASALLAGVRSARVLNAMSEPQAATWGIDERRYYFRVDNGKANLAPPASSAKWRRLIDVDIENGPAGLSDRVGVPATWEPPSASDGVTAADIHSIQQKVEAGAYRASEQASAWVGNAVADVLELDATASRARIKQLLKGWTKDGLLKIEQRLDTKKREQKPFVAVGKWVQA